MKVLFDTNLYIRQIRTGEFRELFETKDRIRYLSPMVMMELLAGAHTAEAKKGLHRLIDPYSRGRRLVSVEPEDFYRAGECLARLGASGADSVHGLGNDILIALSALRVGAVLYTLNRKDFSRIQKHLPVRVEYL